MAAARTGDEDAFAQLYRMFGRVVHGTLLARVAADDAPDLVQEVFLRFLRIERERVVENPQSYLYGIASHVVQEKRRGRLRQRVMFDSDAVEHVAEHPQHVRQDEMADALVLERQIEAASAALTQTQRQILTYWRRDGLSFDAIGQFRKVDRFAGTDIDASGELPDGTRLGSPDDLRRALLSNPNQFAQMLTEKLMMYALGRTLTYKDMPRVRTIVRAAAADNYRFETLVLNIVNSPEFQRARSAAPADVKTAAVQSH